MTKRIITVAALLLSVKANSQQLAEDSIAIKCTELLMTGKPEDKQLAISNIRLLAGFNNEATMEKAATIAFLVGEYELCDSISRVAARRYPNGTTARQIEYAAFGEKKDSGKNLEKAYAKWIAHFPDTTADHDIYDAGRRLIAEQYATERNYARTTLWTSRISNNEEKAKQETDNAVIALNNGDTATALTFQQAGIRRLRQATAQLAPASRGSYYIYLEKYARLLYREKKYAEALTAITEVNSNRQQANSSFNKLYASILTANHKGKEAMPLLDSLFKTGKGDQELLQVLAAAYKQSKGSLDGYNQYVAELNTHMKKMVRQHLAPEKLQLPAPLFALRDAEGKTVALERLKGKTVILDFWATWCGPCKRSFPAMKQAVQRYQQDTTVQFLFIDCMERTRNYVTVVKDYIAANKYPFHVLFDDQPERVFEKYGVTGIPVKFIIDGNGIIRYKLTGFEDGDDAAVEELSVLIENARKSI